MLPSVCQGFRVLVMAYSIGAYKILIRVLDETPRLKADESTRRTNGVPFVLFKGPDLYTEGPQAQTPKGPKFILDS